MNRTSAVALLAIMLLVVLGQAWLLRDREAVPVDQVQLHESRLVPFLQEIRASNPLVHDSILLNLRRLRDAQTQGLDVQYEEARVADELLTRVMGPEAAARTADARAKSP